MRPRDSAWEQGMWDPDAQNCARQWWESGSEQAQFVDALRGVLGLAPLPTPKRDVRDQQL